MAAIALTFDPHRLFYEMERNKLHFEPDVGPVAGPQGDGREYDGWCRRGSAVGGHVELRVLGPVEEETAVAGFRPIEEREWLRISDNRSPQVRKISLRDLDLI